MRILFAAAGAVALGFSAASAVADVVTLKDGSQISGLVESGGTREIQVKVGETSQPVSVDRIQSIQFDEPAASSTPRPRPTRGRRGRVSCAGRARRDRAISPTG